MNQLKDWTSSQVGDEAASILARAKQLKQHSEQVVTKAVKNINDSQIRQRQQQNKSMNVEESLIRVASRVYVKIEALGDKLQARFSGPFTVSKQDENGTYRLKNVVGEEIVFYHSELLGASCGDQSQSFSVLCRNSWDRIFS